MKRGHPYDDPHPFVGDTHYTWRCDDCLEDVSDHRRPARPSWDKWALGIAKAVATRADCTRAQHGAVVLSADRRVVATGYNGAPAGAPGCLTDGACPRANSDVPSGSSYDTGPGACISIHAEANALLHGDWQAYQGGTIYITGAPCDGCRKLIHGAGIKRVVWPEGEYEPGGQ